MSSFKQDFEHSFKVIKSLEERLNSPNSLSVKDDLVNLIYTLDSPLFSQLVNLQDALLQLRALSLQRQLSATKYDFDRKSGRLVVYPQDGIEEEADRGAIWTQGASGVDPLLWKQLEPLAEGRVVETVILEKFDGASLGFGVVGLRSSESGNLGIFVQEIQPGGVAARSGLLRRHDQVLAVNGHVFETDVTRDQAARILHQLTGRIELVVARGPPPPPPPPPPPTTDEGDRVSGGQGLGTGSDDDPDLERPTDSGLGSDGFDMVLSTEWTQLEVINLVNDGSGLGFGIIGGKSTGVVVKTILPGGIADRDGRLHSGDHLIQIGEINVRGMGSEQVASVLRQSEAHVRLLVARGIVEPTPVYPPYAPIIPTQQLSEHINQLNALMTGYPSYGVNPDVDQSMTLMMTEELLPAEIHPPPLDAKSLALDLGPEVEVFSVELVKDVVGLGITVVGYVSTSVTDQGLSGIFVRSISDGSTAALDGRIQINDQIIAVDNQLLEGFTNQESVDILRNTGQVVRLKLARYKYGRKHDLLTQSTAQADCEGAFGVSGKSSVGESVYVVDYEDYSGDLRKEKEELIASRWKRIVGNNFDIIVAQVSKFKEGGGLGISLEGTVDVENGVELHPHHYIRSVVSDGPVGRNGRLQSGDELLEVNGIQLFGLNHVEVVSILKDLPQHVRLVCCRRRPTLLLDPNDYLYAPVRDQFFQIPSPPPSDPAVSLGLGEFPVFGDRLVKAKSEQALPVAEALPEDLVAFSRLKSRSLELLTGLAMWGNDVVELELEKGDRGLGFSILDYQDPINPMETVIIIRSLVPGGVAQLDGRLVPGDRLLYVNDTNLEHATLKQAVTALKGAPLGPVVLGVAKPLPLPDIGDSSWEDLRGDSRFMDAELLTSMGQSSLFYGRLEPGFVTPLDSLGHLSWNEVNHEQASVSPWGSGNETFDSRHLSPKPPTNFAQPEVTSSAAVTRPSGVEFFNHCTVNSRLKDAIDSPSSSSTLSHEMAPSTLTFDSEGSGTKGNSSIGLDRDSSICSSGEGVSTESLVSSGVPSMSNVKPKLPPKPKFVGGRVLAIGRNSPVVTSTEVRPVGGTTLSLSSTMHPTVTEVQQSATSLASPSTKRDRPTVPSPPMGLTERWQSSFARPTNEILPTSLERTIKIHKASGSMGIVVEPTTNNGANGCVVKVIVANEAVAMDGRIQVGDLIVAINNETMRRVTNAQARAILRRASLMAMDISITYISSATLVQHSPTSDWKESPLELMEDQRGGHSSTGPNFCPSHFKQLPSSPSSALPVEDGCPGDRCTRDAVTKVVAMTTVALPAVDQLKLASASQSVMTTPSRSVDIATHDSVVTSSRPVVAMVTHPVYKQQDVTAATAPEIQELISNSDPRQRLVAAYGHLEGEIHMVEMRRSHGSRGLGMCLAGNRDPSRMSSFIAGLLPDSPVALDGRIHVGDQLLQVNEKVLFGRSHLHASAIISSVAEAQLTFVLLRHHNFRLQMATSASLRLPPVQQKDDPSTCISGWPTSRSTVALKEATTTCLTNGSPSVTHDMSATHDGTNSSMTNDGANYFHGNDDASHSYENQVNGNWVNKESGQERLLKWGQGKEYGRGQDVKVRNRQGQDEGQDEGQEVTVEGQSSEREGQIQNEEGHELVKREQKHDNVGHDKAKQDPNEDKETLEQGGEFQGEDKEKQDQAKENQDEDKEMQEQAKENQEEGKEMKGQVNEIEGQHLDRQNQDEEGQEQDKNVLEEGKELHQLGTEGHELDKMSPDQDNEGQDQARAGQEKDKDGQEKDPEELERNREGQEQDRERHEQDREGQEQNREGQEQDIEGQEQDRVGQEQDINPQNNEESSKNKDGSERGTERRVDLVEGELEELDAGESDVGDRIGGVGEAQVVEKPDHEEAPAGWVKCEGQGQTDDQCGNVISSDTAQEDSAKTVSIDRDRKRTTRLKAMEAHVSGSQTVVPLGEAEGASSSSTPPFVQEDPATCPITPGRETTIEIDKGRLALGVDVIGGINTLLGVILIHEIYECGAAAKDGRLAIGDQIIEVNGELFHDMTDELANEILRQSPSVVRLVVYREETPLREEEIYDLFNVDLLKKPGKGLGISIIGRHKDNGIFVSDVIKGGAADLDGQLMPGDQILVINGTDVRHVSQQHAAEMLKTLIGRVSLTVGRVKCLSRSTSRSSSSLSEVDSDEEVAALASTQKRDQGKDKVKEKVTR